jgi:hypothetical protein
VSAILDRMGETSDRGARFSPEQREQVRQAIVGELIRAWDAAVTAGVPADTLAEIIEERRRAIEASLSGETADSSTNGADDLQDGGSDPVDDSGVGQ